MAPGQFLKHYAPYIDTFYVTQIHNCVLCDTFFPVDLIYYKEELLQELVDEHMQLLSFYKYSRGMKSPLTP